MCALLCIAAMLVGACESSVDPFLESDRNFTLFGTLDMARDTQFVRVTPIRDSLEPGAPAPLDVSVASVDLQTGDRVAWSDSILHFDDGSHGHVFYAPLRIRAGHRYRIEVDPGGADVVTFAEVNVPRAPRAVIRPEDVTATVTAGGIVVRGTQEILWEGMDAPPLAVAQWYRFVVSDRLPFEDVLLPGEPAASSVDDDARTWRVVLNLAHDRAVLGTVVNVRGAALAGLGQEVVVMDPAFMPPGSVLNPEVLAQPGFRSNVENGFGYVGAVGRFRAEWTLSPLALDRLGYLDMADLFGGRASEVMEAVRETSMRKRNP